MVPSFRENCHGSLKTEDANELWILGEADSSVGLWQFSGMMALYQLFLKRGLQLSGLRFRGGQSI